MFNNLSHLTQRANELLDSFAVRAVGRDGYVKEVIGTCGPGNLYRYLLNDGSYAEEFIEHEFPHKSFTEFVTGLRLDDREYRWNTGLNIAMADMCGLAHWDLSQKRDFPYVCKTATGITLFTDHCVALRWNPSDNLSLCFTYLEPAMKKRGWHLVTAREDTGWNASFIIPGDRVDSCEWAIEETLPLAICQAAKKTLTTTDNKQKKRIIHKRSGGLCV